MIERFLNLNIAREGPQSIAVLHPGEPLRWECRIQSLDPHDVQAVENSVLWHTEGKGEEDLAVHFFDRQIANESPLRDLSSPRQFETTLPMSPLSYAGFIVKVRWCVRLRVFLKSGKQLSQEVPFQLTAAPPPAAKMPAFTGKAAQVETSIEQVGNDNR